MCFVCAKYKFNRIQAITFFHSSITTQYLYAIEMLLFVRCGWVEFYASIYSMNSIKNFSISKSHTKNANTNNTNNNWLIIEFGPFIFVFLADFVLLDRMLRNKLSRTSSRNTINNFWNSTNSTDSSDWLNSVYDWFRHVWCFLVLILFKLLLWGQTVMSHFTHSYLLKLNTLYGFHWMQSHVLTDPRNSILIFDLSRSWNLKSIGKQW